MNQTDLALLVSLFLPLIATLVMLCIDHYVEGRRKHMLILTVLIIILSVLRELVDNYCYQQGLVTGRLITGVIGYVLRPVPIVLFIQVVKEYSDAVRKPGRVLRVLYRIPWILTGINAAIFMTAFFSDIAFTITEGNVFRRGPLGYSAHIVCIILLAWHVIQTVCLYRAERNRVTVFPLFIAIIIVVATYLDTFILVGYRISLASVVMVWGCVFYYIWLHLIFVREHERDLMAEQRIKIMRSQIGPHFLFNTLSTIQALCEIDPEKAADTAERFGTYLRQNLESLEYDGLIPIEKEIDHTRVYSDIEKTRFPRVQVIYEIADADFELPPLTIQPLVENAIRHGVRSRKEGRVEVRTRHLESGHEILVKDNGVGFDPDALEPSSEGRHIGLMTVRGRIEKLCDGRMDIWSSERGTSITIWIPGQTLAKSD